MLEKEMATHASVLAWGIPGMGELGGLPSMGSHRVRHDWSDLAVAAAAGYIVLITQLCSTLCNPMDCSQPGSSVHGILQASILEWVAMLFSRGIFPTQGLLFIVKRQEFSLITKSKKKEVKQWRSLKFLKSKWPWLRMRFPILLIALVPLMRFN